MNDNNTTKMPDELSINERLCLIENKLDLIYNLLLSGNFSAVQTEQIHQNLQEICQDTNSNDNYSDKFGLNDLDIPTPISYQDYSASNAPTPIAECNISYENAEEIQEDWVAAVTAGQRIRPKFSYEMKLRLANSDVKDMYNQLKNELMSYGLTNRISRFRENFTKNRNKIARFVINGKTLKCYLGIDPNSIDEKYYKHKDMSHKKGTADLPTMINVKSNIAVRKIKELIEIITQDFVIYKKKKYEEVDYTQDLDIRGFSKIELSGYDYMIKPNFSKEQAQELPEFFAEQFINNVKIDPIDQPQRLIAVNLATLCNNFLDNDIVNLDILKQKQLVPLDSNYLSIRSSDIMDKKLTVYCDDISPTASKMISLSGGTIFRQTTNDLSTLAFDDLQEVDFDDDEYEEDFD